MTDRKDSKFLLQTINIWDVVVLIISLGISLFITMNMGEKSYDDAYITFRYAKNLASGEGFVYNSGENVLGTTTPLFTLLLALIRIVFPVAFIPSIGQWLTGVALFCLSFFTYLLGRDDGKPIAGMVSALLVLLNPIFVLVWGGESIFFLALVVAAFYLYFQGYEILPAVIIGLAFLTRGEAILPGLVLFTHYVVVNRKVPWRVIIAFCVTIFPWLLYSLGAFGTPLPSTLQAKMAQMESGVFPPFLITSLDWSRSYVMASPNFPHVTAQYSYFVLVILVFVGGGSLLIRPSQLLWWSIMAWLVLYCIGYSLINVPFYHWYDVPLEA